MPELPEVETTVRGISPHIIGLRISGVIVRHYQLRWPIPDDLSHLISKRKLARITRRAKYLLFHFEHGVLLIHLGMSGSLRLVTPNTKLAKHDHLDLEFDHLWCLRLNDPRRFGAVLWLGPEPVQHPLILKLGIEPLSNAFTGRYLYQKSRQKQQAVKLYIMDQSIVTGVGNIYANEALFRAGIHPKRAAGRIALKRYQRLSEEIKHTLNSAIQAGGTTLRDFVGGDGKPGYFQQQLYVYGKAGQPCPQCLTPLKEIRLSNRSSVYCGACQK